MLLKLITILFFIQLVWTDSSLHHQKGYSKLIDDAYYKDAKSVAELQLKVTRKLKGEKDSLTLLWMNNLAESELLLANARESLQLLEIVGLQSRSRVEESILLTAQYIRSLMLKAKVQLAIGQINACRKTLKTAFDCIDKYKISDTKTVGQLYFVKAKLAIELDQSIVAKEALEKALKIFQDRKHPLLIARTQQLMGEQMLQEGKLIQGRELIDRSIMLRGELQLNRHPDWADALDAMAALLILSGNLGAPLSLVDKAQNIRLEIFDKKHPAQIKSLKMRAFLMESLGDNRSALKEQKSISTKMNKMIPSEHPAFFTINLAISRLHTKLNQLSEAQQHLDKARDIFEIFFKDNNSKKIKLELNEAFIYAASAKYFKANSIYQKILKNKSFAGRSEVLMRAAEVLLLQGNGEAAELHLSERLNLIIKNHGNSHPKVGMAIKKLAALHYEKQKTHIAVKLIKENLEKLIATVGEDHPEVLGRLSELIFYQQIAKQLTDAAESFELALKIQKRNFGYNNPEVLETMNNLSGVYRLIGDKKQAEKLLAEIRLIQAGGNPQDKDILFENSPGSKN